MGFQGKAGEGELDEDSRFTILDIRYSILDEEPAIFGALLNISYTILYVIIQTNRPAGRILRPAWTK